MAVSVTFAVRFRLLIVFGLFFFTLLSCCQNGGSGLPKSKLQQRLSKEVREKKYIINASEERCWQRDVTPACVSVCVCVFESHWKINRWMKYHPNRTSHSGPAEHMLSPLNCRCVQIFTLLLSCLFIPWSGVTLQRQKDGQRLPVCWGNVAQRAARGVLV